MEQTTASKFIVKVSLAKMPNNCWGAKNYVNIALIETDGRSSVSMISERARGVRQIVRMEKGVHLGNTARSAGFRFLKECEKDANAMNKGYKGFRLAHLWGK